MAKRYRKKKKPNKYLVIAFVALVILASTSGLGVWISNNAGPFLAICVVLGILLGVIIALLNTPTAKGKIGELRISLLLKRIVKDNGHVINDIIIPGDDGRTSQIDHVVICANGIHVIETKNYSGRIYGVKDQKEWTQVLAYGRVKNRLYNPIKQNWTHCCRLKDALELEHGVFSYVVFVKGNTRYIHADSVYDPKGLKKAILSKRKIFTPKEVAKIYRMVTEFKEDPVKTSKEHIEDIKKAKAAIERNVCPRCGNFLEIRDGKHGRFYGCSNFPACSFTKKIEE